MTKLEGPAGSGKIAVRIRLQSTLGGERIVRDMTGEWFPKGDHYYIRYEEPEEAEMGHTVTTLQVKADEIRIVRFGDVRFEQTIAAGRRHIGYMQTPHGRMEIETRTHGLSVERAEGLALPVTLRWAYNLTVMGEAAGDYAIELTASPTHG
ncbi:DUF1934 domain-containing protein [Paenibacillus validus]|uniref:DUF1934 family protein n=1 Tax=Paenibacillus validus TaxID=44253 RepID=A0A7X2ZF67_9BACL|nr:MULTISPECIES: DUF1934 domain-containing protein [Paenibacillus]MED4603590.1 DUF1934 domain-containing protein [Paenibacillus validus]MED4607986.1 DUF1934 domain-containing protein [Paenibacillus validus]MUG73815.1 DUF1934 family protein [Paenibacillus validus]